jgi:3-hydroxyacyl-CoA dehydrogenase/enoyl-CoA hydratase/3-hydroxybutyryl-CoA epimerase
MMKNKIEKVCVIGSGVMGSGIAALIANSSHKVLLLDIPSNSPNDRNAATKKALDGMINRHPAALAHPSKLTYITIGNLEDDLNLITECDLIIEVVIEKLEIKHQLYEKIIPYLKKDAIVASNTSTLPLARLKEKLPDSVKSRFLISHFFNPPRHMELLELVIDKTINLEVVERISDFLVKDLGKTIVKCLDTPGFIANRVGCYLLELVVNKAIKANLNPVTVDNIFTKLFKFPSTGVFGLYDLIGHDVMKLISDSLISTLPSSDDYKKVYLNSPTLEKMIKSNLIGRKGLGGFYRMSVINGIKTKEVINLADLSYSPVEKVQEEFKSINELLSSDSVYGKFFQEVMVRFYLYIAGLIPSAAHNVYDIDIAMVLGYSWKIGPFELLMSYIEGGFEWLKEQASITNAPLPEYVANASYKEIDINKFHTNLNIFNKSTILLENNSAKLLLHNDKLVFTINTKVCCLDKNVFNLLLQSIDLAEKKVQDLYIYPSTNYFSAGADLKLFEKYLQDKDFTKLEEFLKLGQNTMMRLKYSSVNIVSCPVGIALGGGCEILLHSDFIVTNQELNAGLVEVALGLVPAWGGIKEMFLRAGNDKEKLLRNLRNIIECNKSSSAEYFIEDYHITNAIVNMKKSLILDDAFNLKLPKKIKTSQDTITLPEISLSKELDTTKYDELQISLISKLQEIISMKSIDEERLLQFERELFLELAKNHRKPLNFIK